MMTTDEYIILAKSIDMGEPVDWSALPIDQDDTYRLVAVSILGMELDTDVLTASLLKLAVENLVLNMQLMEKNS